mgnify:CR=1 FL=1
MNKNLVIEGRTLVDFKAGIAAICLQGRGRLFAEKDVEDLWYLGYEPREAYEELRLERKQESDVLQKVIAPDLFANPREDTDV